LNTNWIEKIAIILLPMSWNKIDCVAGKTFGLKGYRNHFVSYIKMDCVARVIYFEL